MNKARFGIALLAVGVLVALGGFAYVLDHLRASVRVVAGLGEAAEDPTEDPTQPAGESELDAAQPIEDGSARRALPVEKPEPRDLEVHVMSTGEKPVHWAEVLAYRGDELVRAGRTDYKGCAHLIPFSGPGTVRVELGGEEIARQDVAEGRGRVGIAVPLTARVAGVVRVGGVPRENVELMLYGGPHETWLSALVRQPLESLGLQQRSMRFIESTDSKGRFHYEWLKPEWSGVLEIEDTKHYRFADGSTSLVLARPDDALELEVEEIEPELVIRGRVVFHGEPVPGASYREVLSGEHWNWGTNRCDELGRFSIVAPTDDIQMMHLEFLRPGLGVRTLELDGARILGDVELEPTRPVPFVVTAPSGEPLAGARAQPIAEGDPDPEQRWTLLHQNSVSFFASAPTDAEGRGLLHLRTGPGRILVGAPGYAAREVDVPENVDAPLAIRLSRACAIEVRARDSAERIPRGLSLRLTARDPPFTWKNGSIQAPTRSPWARRPGPSAASETGARTSTGWMTTDARAYTTCARASASTSPSWTPTERRSPRRVSSRSNPASGARSSCARA